ncbi:hypothetical protein MSAN_00579200 [Mycena sanguinolenta]|uniref:Uncharacterized protein n=1 Tax=Mycena sanguinolenta TaxID=230812 RepID=A0A8H6Z9Y9_9AGAR|nr:hypothetical protein MSAN_00579200 [Mycena sanguinolenta]
MRTSAVRPRACARVIFFAPSPFPSRVHSEKAPTNDGRDRDQLVLAAVAQPSLTIYTRKSILLITKLINPGSASPARWHELVLTASLAPARGAHCINDAARSVHPPNSNCVRAGRLHPITPTYPTGYRAAKKLPYVSRSVYTEP